jgi:hypothetical protein
MELSAPWARIAPALVLALAASVGAAAESGKAWFD